MFGEIEPLKDWQNEEKIDEVIKRILKIYPKHILTGEYRSYRLRINSKIPHEFSECDTSSEGIGGSNRFNSDGEAIISVSPNSFFAEGLSASEAGNT